MRKCAGSKKRSGMLAAATAACWGLCGVASAGDLLTTLTSFNGSNGENPNGDLALSGSTLYGTTQGGTASNNSYGTVYSVPMSGGKPTTLGVFQLYVGGENPTGGVVVSGNKLYGSTEYGGAYEFGGAIFSLPTTGGSLTNVTSFQPLEGSTVSPKSTPVIVSGNQIFGMTYQGGTQTDGTVYGIPITGGTATTFYDFGSSGSPAYGPTDKLTFYSGAFYGTAQGGLLYNKGVVFSLVTGSTPTVLANFNGSNGANPLGQVLISGSTMYGTTSSGGTSNDGTVWSVPLAGGAITVLGNFNGSNGANPSAGLVIVGGNLYGTAAGTVYSVPLTGGGITTVATFNGANGTGAGGTLVASGTTLYGQTSGGGANGDGTVFSLSTTESANVILGANQFFTVPAVTGTTFITSLTMASGANTVISEAPSPQTRQVVVISALNPAGVFAGRIDVTNNDLDIVGQSLASMTQQVAIGYANGTWISSTGITSSDAEADTTHLTALGIIQNNQSGSAIYTASNLFDGSAPGAGDILIKYTYYGDANLDGKVDGSDYTLIDNGFKHSGTLTGWYNGDFNYDGKIDGSDYTLIDNAFNSQGANLSDTAQFATATAQFGGTSVPEPACITGLAIACIAIRRRCAHLSAIRNRE